MTMTAGRVKVIRFFLVCLQALCTGLSIAIASGNVPGLATPQWSWLAVPLNMVLIAAAAQLPRVQDVRD